MKKTPLKRKTGFKAKHATKRLKLPQKRRKVPSVRLLKKKLWNECKRIIRAKYGNTCYTCGAQPLEKSNFQTGHFIPSSVCSVEMRYSLDNLRPQCFRCNINLSGNWLAYEEHLIKDGINPEILKQRNRNTTGKQYDFLWYENKIAEYKQIL